MRRVRPAGRRIDHQLGVPMIGCNQHRATFCANCRFNPTQAGIHRFNRLDRGLDLAGVANHIGISKVHDDHIERSFFCRLHNCIGNSGSTHLRLQIVRRHLRGWHHNAVLSREWLLDSSVEKICHVRVLLGLGHPQVPHVQPAHDVGQNVRHRLWRNHDRQAEVLVIPRHADIMQILRHPVARHRGIEILRAGQIAAALFVEPTVTRERPRNLPNTVRAEIEADAGVVIVNGRQRLPTAVGTNKRKHKLVGHSLVVRIFHALHRIRLLAALRLCEDHGVVSLGNTFPSTVAIHGVVAAVYRRNLATVVLAHLVL